MTRGPVPGMSKVMTSAVFRLFESRIACRSEPGPASFVFLTTKVSANAPANTRRTLTRRRAAILLVCDAGPRDVASDSDTAPCPCDEEGLRNR